MLYIDLAGTLLGYIEVWWSVQSANQWIFQNRALPAKFSNLLVMCIYCVITNLQAQSDECGSFVVTKW